MVACHISESLLQGALTSPDHWEVQIGVPNRSFEETVMLGPHEAIRVCTESVAPVEGGKEHISKVSENIT